MCQLQYAGTPFGASSSRQGHQIGASFMLVIKGSDKFFYFFFGLANGQARSHFKCCTNISFDLRSIHSSLITAQFPLLLLLCTLQFRNTIFIYISFMHSVNYKT